VGVLYRIYRTDVGSRGSGDRCVSHGQVYLTRLAGWLVKAEKSLAWGKEVALFPYGVAIKVKE